MALKVKDRLEYNAYMAKNHICRYYRLKRRLTKLLGGKCTQCGTTKRLQFDHVRPETKSFALGDYILRCSWAKLLAEVKKCQLLCPVCHTLKTLKDRGQVPARGTHGTLAAYRYCHCAICRGVKAKWTREYRLRLPRSLR
jgi:hypothetical protein